MSSPKEAFPINEGSIPGPDQFNRIIEEGLGGDYTRLAALGESALQHPYGATLMTETPFEGTTAVELGSGTTGTLGGDTDT